MCASHVFLLYTYIYMICCAANIFLRSVNNNDYVHDTSFLIYYNISYEYFFTFLFFLRLLVYTFFKRDTYIYIIHTHTCYALHHRDIMSSFPFCIEIFFKNYFHTKFLGFFFYFFFLPFFLPFFFPFFPPPFSAFCFKYTRPRR